MISILVAHPDEVIRETKIVLEQYFHLQVDYVRSNPATWEALANKQYDVVFYEQELARERDYDAGLEMLAAHPETPFVATHWTGEKKDKTLMDNFEHSIESFELVNSWSREAPLRSIFNKLNLPLTRKA